MNALRSRSRWISLVIFIMIIGMYNTKAYAEEVQVDDENETQYETTTIEFLEPAEPMQYTQEELDCLARVMYAEAGGCDDTELYLVANVVVNRVNDKSGNFKDSIIDVIYQTGQFTSVGDKAWNRGPTQREYAIAKNVLEGARVAPSNVYWFSRGMSYGSLYYKSQWHYFTGMDLPQKVQETVKTTVELTQEEIKQEDVKEENIVVVNQIKQKRDEMVETLLKEDIVNQPQVVSCLREREDIEEQEDINLDVCKLEISTNLTSKEKISVNAENQEKIELVKEISNVKGKNNATNKSSKKGQEKELQIALKIKV